MADKIDKLLATLSDPDWWSRHKAIRELIQHPESEYADFLSAALRDNDDANIRNAAMETYTELGERALPLLIPFLQDPDPEIRLFSVNILGDIRSLKALQPLCSIIRDPDENVRIAVAESLGKIGDAGALAVLRKALTQDAWLAMAALHAIGNIGGSSSLEILYSCLPNEELREFALTAIELAGDESSIEPLIQVVKGSADTFHKELALKALVGIAHRKGFQIGRERVLPLVPDLISLAEARDTDIRIAALIALSWSEDSRALPLFVAAIQDEQFQEQGTAGILSIGPSAIGALRDALSDPTTSFQDLIKELLCRLGEEDACIKSGAES